MPQVHGGPMAGRTVLVSGRQRRNWQGNRAQFGQDRRQHRDNGIDAGRTENAADEIPAATGA